MFKFIPTLLAAAILPAAVYSYTSYDNEFVNATYMLSKNYPETTIIAQNTIITWADQYSALGPWSVMNKSVLAPTGDKHTYLSWAPYWWPDCSGVGNTTELTPEQIWTTCPYHQRDGQFNPDRLLVNDTGNLNALADTVLCNSRAWAINGSERFENTVASFITTWFINPETYMYPNLDYAQMNRGPDGQKGAHTGLLDMKCMAKIATGIEILRQGNSKAWTPELDSQMKNWTSTYIQWATTAQMALDEKTADNNHGSYYFNQLAALYIIMEDPTSAKNILQEYFEGIYLGQIDADGKQPLELARTHPYHYTCYNLFAMIMNAKLAAYVGYDTWNIPTKSGGTIQKALDFALTLDPGEEPPSELYSEVATIASVFGDPTGKYATFLAKADPEYPAEPYFLWYQPFSDSGWVAKNKDDIPGNNGLGGSNPSSGGGSANDSDNNSAMGVGLGGYYLAFGAVLSAFLFV